MKKILSLAMSCVIALCSVLFTFGVTASADDFENYLTAQGFPESYKVQLRQLHAAYPNWTFKAFQTGLDWNGAVAGERSYHSKQLIQNISSNPDSLKCNCSNCYKNGKFVVQEASNWVSASETAVKYYMDPRNFLDENNIFQFEETTYDPTQTQAGVETILYGTWMYNSAIAYKDAFGNILVEAGNKTYSQAIMEAASVSGMSAYYLASKIVQEVGGAAATAGGACGTYPNYPGIYNYYNIGAYTGAADGLKYASQTDVATGRPWDSPYKSIINGAKWIYKSFSQYQNTGYLQKFNVNAASGSLYSHEYMANVQAASSEAVKAAKAYRNAGILNSSHTFSIPVFNNMPDDPSTMTSAQIVNLNGIVKADQLNVRSGPGSQYPIITRIANGTVVAISEINGNWYKITVNGITGYSSKDYIDIIDTATGLTQVRKLTMSPRKTTNSLTYTWASVSGAEGYEISVKNNTKNKQLSTKRTTKTSITLSKLTNANSYSIKVRAYKTVNGQRQYGPYSATNTKHVMPSKVTGLKTKSRSDKSIRLSWNKKSGATGYKIYKYFKDSDSFKLIATVYGEDVTEYKLTGFNPGTCYYFYIKAFVTDDCGNKDGSKSDEITSGTRPKKPSVSRASSPSAKKITVKWSKVRCSGYQIQWSTSSSFSSNKKEATVKNGSATQQTVSVYSSGKKYYIRVRAYKTINGKKYYSSWSNAKAVNVK